MSTAVQAKAQRAHDVLLAKQPAGTAHSCDLCTTGSDIQSQTTGEVAVANAVANTYTEEQHAAILASRLGAETAALTEKVETVEAEKSALVTRVEVLEAEVARLTEAKDAAEKAFEDYKAEQAAAIERADRREARVAEVSSIMGNLVAVTEERAARWTDMSDDAFGALLDEYREVAAKAPHAYTASAEDTAACAVCTQAETASVHPVAQAAEQATKEETGRETAALSTGKSPSAKREGYLVTGLSGVQS